MNYYNEHDKNAAKWLRVLIEEGRISPGIVDERDIQDVKPDELAEFKQCHFFAGIGGWSLALRLAGVPDEEPVWTGSCPCQPFSVAGAGMGEADERHLWPDFRNLIGNCRPPVVFGEQVARKVGFGWFSRVRADLESAAYAVGCADLCAAGIGSPHIRQRIYWMANDQGQGRARMESKRPAGLVQRARPWSGGAVGPVANCEREGLEGHAGNVGDGHQPGWLDQEPARPASKGGGIGGVGDTKHLRCDKGQSRDGCGQEGAGSTSGTVAHRPSPAIDGVDNSISGGERGGDKRGLGAQGQQVGEQENRPGASIQSGDGCQDVGFWSKYRVITCRDGKVRRIPIEPAFFPLADGFPGRVAVLKGFGNAIIPELAAEFIKASYEAMTL